MMSDHDTTSSTRAAAAGERRLRVVHVCGGTRTGCTRVVLDLCARHDRRAIDPAVCFFAVVDADPASLDEARALGVAVRAVRKTSRYDPMSIARLSSALRSLGAEVAVLHGFGAYSFGSLAARLGRVPAVVRVEHNPELYGPSYRLGSRVTAGLVDSTVLVSDYLRGYLESAGTRLPRPEVIHNGLSLDGLRVGRAPFEGEASLREPVVFMAARLDPQKDHGTLLEAVARLKARGVALRLRLAGTGPLEAALREQASRLGLDGVVEFLGWRGDVARCLEEADIGVLSTHYEGFGLAAVEAMATGRPVVCTRVASLPEIVEDGVHGLLVPPRSPEALAEALASLLADPERARAMGEAGRRCAHERFAIERTVARFDRHLLATAARKGLVPAHATARASMP